MHSAMLPIAAEIDSGDEDGEANWIWKVAKHIQVEEGGVVSKHGIDPSYERLLKQAVNSADDEKRVQ